MFGLFRRNKKKEEIKNNTITTQDERYLKSKQVAIMDFLYKNENVNGFGIVMTYNSISDIETIIIEVFSRHTDIIDELLALNCFAEIEGLSWHTDIIDYFLALKCATEEEIRQVYNKEDVRQFKFYSMNEIFGSFKDEYQIYKRKKNIEKI